MRKLALAALTVLTLLPVPGASKEKVLRFTGAFVVDDDLGISVGADEKKRLIAVLSPRFRSGLWNLTLSAWDSHETPAEHVAEKKKLLETGPAGKGMKKMETLSWKGQQVLRNEVDGGAFDERFKGVTIVHYFVAKSAKGVLYELHLSVVVDPKKRDAFVDADWVNYAAVGFLVGDDVTKR